MATLTRKYDNGPNGWTDYDENGNSVAAGTYNAPGTARNPYNADPNAQIAGNNGGMNSGSASLWTNNPAGTVGAMNGSSSSSSSSSNYSQPTAQSSYQQQLTEYQNLIAEQAAKAKQDALKSAWEGNSQALNSQKSTVDNNYTSAANKLNAVQAARLPEFQQAKNAASAEAAQIALRNQELMAATGRGDSGYSRSTALATDLNRSNALSALTGSENAFKTDVSNQLSDVDAQRVAALNDIAGKLQLGEKQFNDGTLSLTNQLESEKASGAIQAFLEAQQRADTLAQQQFSNSFQEKQFEQNATLAELQQQFQQKQFQAEQDAQLWQQQFQQQGFTADEAYKKAQMQMQQEIQAAEQAYKYAALSASSSTKSPTSAEINSQKDSLISQVTSSIYNKVYTQNNSAASALSTLSQNKGAILSDLTAAGMSAKEALEYYQQMYDDLSGD